MKNLFKKIKGGYVISSLFFAILGIVLIFYPAMSFDIMCKAVGIIMVAFGVTEIAMYFSKPEFFGGQALLIVNIIICVVGLWLVSSPEFIKGLIPIILGVIMIFHGVSDLRYSTDMKNIGAASWRGASVVGVVTLILGIVVILNPFETGDLITRLIGAFFVYDGFSALWIILSLYFKEFKLKQQAKDVEYREIEGK